MQRVFSLPNFTTNKTDCKKNLLNTIKLSSKHYLDETSPNFVYGLIIAKSMSSLSKLVQSEKPINFSNKSPSLDLTD